MTYSFPKTAVVYAIAAMIIPGLLLTASCGKKTVTSEITSIEDQTSDAEKARIREEARIREMELEEQKIREQNAAKERYYFENENIHFNYDSSLLSDEAKRILQEKADYLKRFPNLNITVQGHCDERGTTEYNLGLGERRAITVKKYLEDLGIFSSRISTVSYGEEMPIDPASTPAAWQKNRRAQFVIQ